MQEGLWCFIKPDSDQLDTATSLNASSNLVNVAMPNVSFGEGSPDNRSPMVNIPTVSLTGTYGAWTNELCFRTGKIIISLVRDSIILNVIHLTDPKAI